MPLIPGASELPTYQGYFNFQTSQGNGSIDLIFRFDTMASPDFTEAGMDIVVQDFLNYLQAHPLALNNPVDLVAGYVGKRQVDQAEIRPDIAPE